MRKGVENDFRQKNYYIRYILCIIELSTGFNCIIATQSLVYFSHKGTKNGNKVILFHTSLDLFPLSLISTMEEGNNPFSTKSTRSLMNDAAARRNAKVKDKR